MGSTFRKRQLWIPSRRSTHDAIEAIQTNLRNHNGEKDYHKYILDADITKCFDQINHDYLLEKLDTLPEIKTQVKAWLKAGIMEELQTNINLDTVPPNTIGTCSSYCLLL
jgi:retron-type reverse transcriptase